MEEEKGTQAEERQDEPRLWRPWRPPRRRTAWRVLWAVGMMVAVLIAVLTTALLILDLPPEIIWKGLSHGSILPLVALGFSLTAIVVMLAWRPPRRWTAWRVLWAVGMVVAVLIFVLTTALLILVLPPEIWKGLSESWIEIWKGLSESWILTLVALGFSLTAIVVMLAIAGARRSWTGFQGKTVWDFLQLLIVPLMLVAIGLVFALQQDARQQRVEDQRADAERKLADQRAQDEALQAYLDQMSQLLLDRKLLEAEQGTPLYTLAQARTSTLILRLDAEHNESVTRFLINSGLAESSEASARLLREITLSHATLSDAYLRNADLSNADLSGADLSNAFSLSGPRQFFTYMRGANLSHADLSHAVLNNVVLSNADLSDADLYGTGLRGTRLSGAYLRYAEGITGEKLAQQAWTLKGATMPDGQKYEDWRKDKGGRKEDGGNG